MKNRLHATAPTITVSARQEAAADATEGSPLDTNVMTTEKEDVMNAKATTKTTTSYYLVHDLVPVGRFATRKAAHEAQGSEGKWIVIGTLDDCEHMRISEIMQMRAALGVKGSAGADTDAPAKKIKDKRVAGRALLRELDAHTFTTPAPAAASAAAATTEETEMAKRTKPARSARKAAAPKERKERPSAKRHLRELYARKGSSHTIDEILQNYPFTKGAIATAISDLKNKKYCGEEGPIFIERQENGEYKRVA